MASELKKTGFRNPLNYYRNIDRNWQLLAPWAGAAIHQPALFIAGKEDHVIRGPTGEKQLKELPTTVPGLKDTVLLDGVGHYVQQERPQAVTAALLDFLKTLDLTRNRTAQHVKAPIPEAPNLRDRGCC